jgi:hypothetical protein
MSLRRRPVRLGLLFTAVSILALAPTSAMAQDKAIGSSAQAKNFTWDWRTQQIIGRLAPSLNNTSELTEPQRTALLNAIARDLAGPLRERGYDDDRIREIASTTRLQFTELGEGKPVILATSLGLEGGCDALVNCPFWIFRQGKSGYVLMLETDAASYTKQSTATGGYTDLVMARHVTPSENRLTLYKYANGKYTDAGCYTATFAPQGDDGEVHDPDIAPCEKEKSK